MAEPWARTGKKEGQQQGASRSGCGKSRLGILKRAAGDRRLLPVRRELDAGAVTQGASIYTAILIALVSMLLTPALYFLPVTLAATIIVAVLSLVDLSITLKDLALFRVTVSRF